MFQRRKRRKIVIVDSSFSSININKMAGRYLITGAQIGMLIALLNAGADEQARATIREIYQDQFLGNSQRHISQDVDEISNLFYPTKEKVMRNVRR